MWNIWQLLICYSPTIRRHFHYAQLLTCQHPSHSQRKPTSRNELVPYSLWVSSVDPHTRTEFLCIHDPAELPLRTTIHVHTTINLNVCQRLPQLVHAWYREVGTDEWILMNTWDRDVIMCLRNGNDRSYTASELVPSTMHDAGRANVRSIVNFWFSHDQD